MTDHSQRRSRRAGSGRQDAPKPRVVLASNWDEHDRLFAEEVSRFARRPSAGEIESVLAELRERAQKDPEEWHNPGQITPRLDVLSAQPALEELVRAGVAERAVYHGSYTNMVYRLLPAR